MLNRIPAARAIWASTTAITAAAFAIAAPASAQDGGAEEAEEGKLPSIIVTANRREENIQDVPVSAEILDKERIG
ncbi:MAG: hypothetical protein AAFN48_01300, partial [Pseudomonadota bacterium]